MNRNFFFLTLCLLLACGSLSAQDSIREALRNHPSFYGGSSMPYQYTPQVYTPAPKGFSPFHVEHIGRHGSRMHASPKTTIHLYTQLAAADSMGLLTQKGKQLLDELKQMCAYSYRRYGDLTELGMRQHKQVAQRMYRNFPEIFAGKQGGRVTAVSTIIPRSMVSMASFTEEMKGRNPALRIHQNASSSFDLYLRFNTGEEYQRYLTSGAWLPVYNAYLQVGPDPARLMNSLMKSVPGEIVPDSRIFMNDLFSLAAILPNTELDFSWYGLFTEEELFGLWKVANLRSYLLKLDSEPGQGLPVVMAKPMMRNMLDSAQVAIDGGETLANLRFAHGENTMPLAALLEIEGMEVREPDPDKVYRVWQDFNANPMATNIQWVFYRSKSGEVLIKVLFNEREVRLPLPSSTAPYYEWADFKQFYGDKIDRMPDMKPLPEVATGY